MCRNRQPHCRQSEGFTLLEVLIALALLGVLSAALYGTWFSLVRGRESASAAMAGRRELRTTLDTLQRELSAAFFRKDPDTTKQRFQFAVEDRDFFGKPASTLSFTTLSPPHVGNYALSDQTMVRYRPIEREGKIILTRQVKDVYMEGETPPYPQMEEIEGFLVECSYDGTKWVKTWDTATNQKLPKTVRVTVKVKEGDKTVDFTTVASPKMQ